MARLDCLLRRAYGVVEFSADAGCILRMALSRATADLTLADGERIHRGDLVAEFHLWNERVPPMAPSGPDLAWGRAFHAGFVRSLRLLATTMHTVPRFAAVRAICGESAFAQSDSESGARFAHALGFDFVRIPEAATRWGRFHEFWANFYSRMLIWTYNPASLRGKGITQLRRYQLWMSRARLDQRYGALKTDGDL